MWPWRESAVFIPLPQATQVALFKNKVKVDCIVLFGVAIFRFHFLSVMLMGDIKRRANKTSIQLNSYYCGEANLEDDKKDMYVVVKLYSWIKCYFPLFWAMVVYDNELKQEPINLMGFWFKTKVNKF